MLRFHSGYFIVALVIFCIEVCIALFVDDHFIRPHVGDVLVVILIYTVVRAFLKTPVLATIVAVLLFAFLIETLQYFQMVKQLGLSHIAVARIVIGTTFSWIDILCYIIGAGILLLIEKRNGAY